MLLRIIHIYSCVYSSDVATLNGTESKSKFEVYSSTATVAVDADEDDTTVHRVSKRNCAKLFLSDVRQISTNFDNFWHTDSTKDRFM